MLLSRIITAVILALTLLVVVLALDFEIVKLFFTVILFLASYELLRLAGIKSMTMLDLVGIALSFVFYLSFNYFVIYIEQAVYIASLMWLGILGVLYFYNSETVWGLPHKVIHAAVGSIFIFITVHSLLFIHQYAEIGPWFMLYILSIVWVADIGAYFTGRAWGKHKLAYAISPGKSIEGVIGGLGFNVVWAWITYTLFFSSIMSLKHFMLVSLVSSLISVAGDLYESVLKRQAGMKDSGKLLPGHGGLLDRIDSVLAAAPIFVCGLFLVGAV